MSAEPTLNDAQVLSRVQNMAETAYQNKIAPIEPGLWHGYERAVMLQVLDSHWREHLAALDHLRQGIHLRGYAQKNPKQEYKREAFELFGLMLDAIKREVTRALCRVEITTSEAVAEATERVVEEDEPGQVSYQHGALAVGDSEEAMDEPPEKRVLSAEARMRVGRNDPCPCGSGKKYKHCHGRL
ncbi:MAG: SEC-C metal-binding domain-containing protein [Ferrovum myxofaciens]